MAPRYALAQFSTHVAALAGGAGADDFVDLGAQRDSAHPTVVQCPTMFTATPPTAASVGPLQFAYLQQYPSGWVGPTG